MASDLGERAKAYAIGFTVEDEVVYDDIGRAWLAGYRAAIADAAKVLEDAAHKEKAGGHSTLRIAASNGLFNGANMVRALAPPA